MTENEIDVSKYIGKSYSDYDCYSLFLAIERDLGHNIKDLRQSGKNKIEREKEIEAGKKDAQFEKIEKPVAGCGVILMHNDIPQHIGVYIGNNKVIHSTVDRGVIIDEIRVLQVEGFYRVKS